MRRCRSPFPDTAQLALTNPRVVMHAEELPNVIPHDLQRFHSLHRRAQQLPRSALNRRDFVVLALGEVGEGAGSVVVRLVAARGRVVGVTLVEQLQLVPRLDLRRVLTGEDLHLNVREVRGREEVVPDVDRRVGVDKAEALVAGLQVGGFGAGRGEEEAAEAGEAVDVDGSRVEAGGGAFRVGVGLASLLLGEQLGVGLGWRDAIG